MNLFLETATLINEMDPYTATGILAAIMAFLVIFLILGLAIYIYISFAFMAIGKKVKYPTPGIAWIPFIGPALITSKTAKMHWWPILLLIGIFVPLVNSLFLLVFGIFFVIWLWKTYEVIKKPGWWAILMIIPVVNIVGLILLGVAAWSKK